MSEFSYPDVGASLSGSAPRGYRALRYGGVVGSGRSVYEAVSEALWRWELHRGAGVVPVSGASRAAAGAEVWFRPWRLPTVLKNLVIAEVMEAAPGELQRTGYAYGTLPGHPECGEALFVVALHDSGDVTFTVTGFSRPVSRFAKAIGPVTNWLQDRANNGYVAAAREVAAAVAAQAPR